MSLKTLYLDWPSRNVDAFRYVVWNWHLINIRLNLRSMIGPVMFGFGSEVAISVHGLDAKGHLTVAVAYCHYLTMVSVSRLANMRLYLVMETLDWNRCPNHGHAIDH